jgi:hypothetical protein
MIDAPPVSLAQVVERAANADDGKDEEEGVSVKENGLGVKVHGGSSRDVAKDV